jgi:hypothetical protein
MLRIASYTLRDLLYAAGRAGCMMLCIVVILVGLSRQAYGYKIPPAEGGVNGGTNSNPNDPDPGSPIFDETSVFINVQRIGGTEIPAVIRDRIVYLPINTVFDFLKIKNETALSYDSVYGYFIDPAAHYCIDNIKYEIRYKGQVFQLQSTDLVQTESGLYLRQEFFSLVFGLTCVFDFRSLMVRMSSSVELPAVREMQLEQMHRNVNRLKGEVKADTTIARRYSWFNLGAIDWTINNTQQSNGTNNCRAGIALGGVVAGGEANVFLNYSDSEPFNERQQFYQWRFANNDFKAIRQVTLGRIQSQSIASLFGPMTGVQVTNTPTTYRRSFGTYRLTRTTQPGWTVELYVNNVLVDYVKADASGFFAFDVPLVYGNSIVKLRFYGLYGEERTSEENITIPFNFIPKHEVEYTASAGVVDDTLRSRFARANMNYGVGRNLTIGAGAEYLSSIITKPALPFLNASVRITSDIMFNGEYVHGVKSRGMLTYRTPLKGQLEVSYARYVKDQKAIMYNYLEERKLTYSMPYNTKLVSGVTRLVFNQIIVTNNTNYTTAELLLSANTRKVSANLSTYLIGTGQQDPPIFEPYLYSNASIAYRFLKGYTITPQVQYSYTDKSFISVRCELEKYLFTRGYLNISYEQNFKSKVQSFGAGIRYDLSFARVGFSARQYSESTGFSETASGSLSFDRKTRHIGVNNRAGVGRAGITLLAFLDVNGNGTRDVGERKVEGLKVRINSGRIEYGVKDTVVRVYDLEPYTTYFIDISQNSFENIGWQIRKKTMNVAVDPNELKLIEVPVTVMSEASGSVYLKGSGGTKGQGRINVCFYREDGSQAGCALTDPDGYFSYMGLLPGTYTVRPDETQLKNLSMTALPEKAVINIEATREGIFLENLDFTIGAGRK